MRSASEFHDLTLAERMRLKLTEMSPGERRIVRFFLSLSDVAPLETAKTVAENADVSVPTVLRCLSKIGFKHYGDFRDFAEDEIRTKRESALNQMPPPKLNIEGSGKNKLNGETPQSAKQTYEKVTSSLIKALQTTFSRLNYQELENAIALQSDLQRKQMFIGGRFSHSIAEQLYLHANLVRPGCRLASSLHTSRETRLLDINRAHVVTVFDFRRYQHDIVEFAREAKQRRAKIILVTDQWMSPIADWADVVLISEVRIASAFDTTVPALAMIEIMLTGLYEALGDEAHKRLEQFEALNTGFEWNAITATLQNNNETTSVRK